MQLADVIEPGSDPRLFDSGVTTPHRFFPVSEKHVGRSGVD